MKKVIPFTKEIPFRTMIGEITDITVEHTLTVKDSNTVEGDFLVSGTYKMTEASQIEEPFEHNLPFTIELDEHYDLSECKINISDFYFEIINEEILKVNIEVEISELEEKSFLEEVREELETEDEVPVEVLEKTKDELSLDIETIRNQIQKVEPIEHMMTKEEIETPMEEIEIEVEEIVPIEMKSPVPIKKMTQEIPENKNSVSSIFTAISATEETFSTYHVYIVRNGDTVDSIIDTYKTTKEDLGCYNDLSDIKVGSKIIIPCANE